MGTKVVYVGNLPGDVLEKEVEDIFYKYGNIKRISIKPGEAGGMPAFCFVEFDHADEAYDAVKAMDGREKLGKRLRVELSRGGRRDRDDYGRGGDGRDYGRGGDRFGGDRYRDDRRRNPRPYNTSFRVVVSGLPATASWQDLKDHMRKGGEVTFAQVVRDGDGVLGIVDYATSDDMYTAIKKLDDTEFRNPYDKSYIRVKEDTRPRGDDRGGRGDRYEARRSPSPRSPRGDRSPRRDRSPPGDEPEPRGREDDRGRSRSRSLSRGRGRDRSRS